MNIKDEEYQVETTLDGESICAHFQGTLRLRGESDYAPIIGLLDDVVKQASPIIILDLRRLRFLNSFGINVIFQFVIKVRELGKSHLIAMGATGATWQNKSMINMQRLLPSMELRWE